MSETGGLFAVLGDPSLFALTVAGTVAGIYIGAIPGLSVTMTVSILISFTFAWDLDAALALMVGVFMGGVYGGGRTAILLNIPGAPSAIATALDGYPLAQRGQAGVAIGVTTVMSFVGGFVGIGLLALGAPLLAEFALAFAPRDYFLLALIGLFLVGSLAGAALARGVFCAAFGVWLSTIGLDPLTAQERYTFGAIELVSGVPYIAAMIGLFGVAEVLHQMRGFELPGVRQSIDRIVPEFARIRRFLPNSLRAGLLGGLVGILPGAGGDMAALLAYGDAKRSVRSPETPFGEGAWEGLVASESANNAAVGGAFVPMLTLGIPGDAVTAVFVGALFVHGVQPGPQLLVQTPELFWFTVGALILANVCVLVFGLTGARLFSRIIECPKAVLFPVVIVLSTVGSFSIRNSMTDVAWMFGFGLLGLLLKRQNFPVAPVVLGIILGPMIDLGLRRTLVSVQNDPVALALEFVGHPISAVLSLVLLALVASGVRGALRTRG
jgi:putative tricarboxylic transport membrane protein